MKGLIYNRNLLFVLCGILLVLCFLNIFIDPYNIFNAPAIKHLNYYKPEAKRQERLTKFLNFKTLKNIETIFCGVSRTDWTLEPDYYKKLTGKNAANMAMAAATFSEYKDIIRYSKIIHPEIKTILIAIDVDHFISLQDGENNLQIKTENPHITTGEIAAVVFSIDTTISSIITISKNITNTLDKAYLNNGMKYPYYNTNIKETFAGSINLYKHAGIDWKITQENLIPLKNLITELNKQGVNVILYIPPMHATYMEILANNNALNALDKFKEDLAQLQPYYDFMYINQINEEEIKPEMKYYFETSHATYHTGKYVLDKIFANKGDFGVLVTPKNVKSHNLHNRKLLKKWQKENHEVKQWVDSIVNSKE